MRSKEEDMAILEKWISECETDIICWKEEIKETRKDIKKYKKELTSLKLE